jgi:hypothetical protein
MGKVMNSAWLIIITTFVLSVAHGQTDLILLNESGNQQVEVRSSTESSSRYTVKPKPRPAKVSPTPMPAPRTGGPVYGPEVNSQKDLEQATTLPLVAPADPQAAQDKSENPNMLEKARDLVMGGPPEVLDEYRAYLQPEDIRKNLIEIYLAPFFVYNDSTSSSFSRSYNTFMPGLYLSNDIWFTMFFGLNTSYRRTLAGSVANNPPSTSFVAADQEWASIGLRFRRFYGFGKTVPSLSFGVDLHEYQMRVASDDDHRLKLRTTGVRVSLEAKIPSSQRYSSTYQFDIQPWAVHSESTIGTATLSGQQNSTFGFGLGLGGEYKLERTSRLFWKATYELQRSLYTGSASGPDAISGDTLSNVPVSNGFILFEFGYIWGK